MFARASPRSIVPSICIALIALCPAAVAGNVFVVSPTGPYTQIQPAIDAASDYDTILVKPHPSASSFYDGFVVSGKSLAIVGETNTSLPVLVRGEMRIDGLAAGALVVLGNIEGHQALGAGGSGGYALRTIENDGAFRVEKCKLVGHTGSGSTYPFRCTWIGEDSDTQFIASDIVGSTGYSTSLSASSGQNGLYSLAPALRMFDCAVVGGRGGSNGNPDDEVGNINGAAGGHGLEIGEGLVFAAACAFQAGNGGAGSWVFCPEWGPGGEGGDGGDGILIGQSPAPNGITSHVFSLTCSMVEGAGGAGGGGCPTGPSGQPGVPVRVQQSGAWQQFANGQARFLTGTPLAREHTSVELTANGANGDRVYVRLEEVTQSSPLPSPGGPLRSALEHAQKPRVVFLGTIPASGTLTAMLPVGSLPAGFATKWWTLHSTFVVASGVVAEGNDFVVAIVDSSF